MAACHWNLSVSVHDVLKAKRDRLMHTCGCRLMHTWHRLAYVLCKRFKKSLVYFLQGAVMTLLSRLITHHLYHLMAPRQFVQHLLYWAYDESSKVIFSEIDNANFNTLRLDLKDMQQFQWTTLNLLLHPRPFQLRRARVRYPEVVS